MSHCLPQFIISTPKSKFHPTSHHKNILKLSVKVLKTIYLVERILPATWPASNILCCFRSIFNTYDFFVRDFTATIHWHMNESLFLCVHSSRTRWVFCRKPCSPLSECCTHDLNRACRWVSLFLVLFLSLILLAFVERLPVSPFTVIVCTECRFAFYGLDFAV